MTVDNAEVIALHMANLAADFDRQAVHAETGMDGGIAGSIAARERADTFRRCANLVRERVESLRCPVSVTVHVNMSTEHTRNQFEHALAYIHRTYGARPGSPPGTEIP